MMKPSFFSIIVPRVRKNFKTPALRHRTKGLLKNGDARCSLRGRKFQKTTVSPLKLSLSSRDINLDSLDTLA